jgi:hypothetical protein
VQENIMTERRRGVDLYVSNLDCEDEASVAGESVLVENLPCDQGHEQQPTYDRRGTNRMVIPT